jgi:large subunit ribosomal protein L6
MEKSLNFNVLRQTKNLQLQILCEEKKILLRGLYGSFLVPIKSPFFYSRKDRKLYIASSYKKKANLFFVLLLQAGLGVLLGYRRQLNVVGIGYHVEIEDSNILVLKLGFSHLVRLKVPPYLKVLSPKPRIILLKGVNLQKLNNFASKLRQLKLPSSYKEKGIYFSNEKVLIKQGKKT